MINEDIKIVEDGVTAPKFSLYSDQNQLISLSQFEGKKVILYFYPKNNTPACTQEAKDFRDNMKFFNDNNIEIIGISKDGINSHRRFKEICDLPFHLLSDPECNVIKAYQAWVEKSMFGKKHMGIDRRTFLINEHGKIVKIWTKVKVQNHINEIIKFIDNYR